MINLSSTNLSPLNLGGMNTSEIKLGYPSSGCPVPGLKGLQGLYMGKGLTNEMMSRDPIWRDKSGKGNHIQLKNFDWSGISGIGAYDPFIKKGSFEQGEYGVVNFSPNIYSKTIIAHTIGGDYIHKLIFKIEGISNTVGNCAINIREINTDSTINRGVYIKTFNQDGVYEINYSYTGEYPTYLLIYNGYGLSAADRVNFKVTILPSYQGAICFDGVDDFGETIKDLNFTDNYSVVSLVVPFYNNRNNVIFGKDHTKDVYSNFSNQIRYYSVNRSISILVDLLVKEQVRLLVCRRNKSIQEIKDIFSNRSNSAVSIPVIDNPGKYYLGRSQTVHYACGAFAMFAHAIFDHYISDNELQILSDYWKKEFPELFPDQAWTVTGKTNSDADRATIKNITGNGNDLVLTNFAFAENSGYGKWPFPFPTASTAFKDQPYGTAHFIADGSTYSTLVTKNLNSVHFKFRVREMQEGGTFVVRSVRMDNFNVAYKDFRVSENGIHEFEYENTDEPFALFFYNGKLGSGVYWDFYVDILQDPDYEGYLVTDGVDDQISSGNIAFGDDWTIVGDWFFYKKENKNCGLVAPSNFYIYNSTEGYLVYIKRGNAPDLLKGILRLKAVCSDGRVYDENWNEIKLNSGTMKNNTPIRIGYLSERYTPTAFKNLGVYNNAILTKEQCIRSYNYLQTIKNN